MRTFLIVLLSFFSLLAQARTVVCVDENAMMFANRPGVLPGKLKLELDGRNVISALYAADGENYSPLDSFRPTEANAHIRSGSEHEFELQTCDKLLSGKMSIDVFGSEITLMIPDGRVINLFCE